VQVLGVYPHAHYLAKEMTGRALLPDGREIPLIRIPQWNFNWQDEYRYPQPIALPAGTTLEMEYSYDNSEDNPVNPHHPPRRVVWGPSSKDEMGDLWVQLLPENNSALRTLKQAFMGNEFEARLSGFAHAVRINPDDLEAQYNLGSLSEQAGRLDDAEQHYREALRIDPEHPQSLNNLGVLLCRRGEIPAAVPLFEKALQILPDYDEARDNLKQARNLSTGQQ
jgi:tetratricopeptide (TPR) repeat protein